MKRLGGVISRWVFRRFHPSVRVGWLAANAGLQKRDYPRAGYGLGLIAFGLLIGRSRRRIYKTSIDTDEGVTIRVLRGRKPIAETAPIP